MFITNSEGVMVFIFEPSWSYLILPLSRKHLGIDSMYHQSCIQAGFGVGFDEVTSEDLLRTDPTVVRALRCRIAIVRPTQRVSTTVKGVFLLKTHPRFESRSTCIQNLTQTGSIVAFMGKPFDIEDLTEYKKVAFPS
jgi:hypothetical protein